MKRNIHAKGITIFLVIAFLFSSYAGVTGFSNSNDEMISFIIAIEDYKIIETDRGHEIVMDNFGRLINPGHPNLPSKIFSIAIPPESTITHIDIETTETVQLPGSYDIVTCQKPQVIGDIEIKNENKLIEIFESDDPYPESVGHFVQKSFYRKYDLVDVRVNPFTYYPLSGILEYHPHITINIYYEQEDDSKKENVDNLVEPEKTAERIINNYYQAQQWYKDSEPSKKGLYDYVIITLDSLTSAVSSLESWEISKGSNVNVVTVSWITANYDGYDAQEKIRNFLRDKYLEEEWGIENVLLVGHYDDVPMRRCAQDLGYGQPETDYYYAELSLPDDQSWDADGDHQYGEDTDTLDFYAEVNVGRIPTSSSVEVADICNKMVAYEQNNDPSYKNNILLLGAFFWEDTDNAVLMEEIASHPSMSDWTKTRMYEEDQSMYDCDYDLSYSTVENIWSSEQYAFVNWAGHGSPTSCHEMYPEATSPAFVDTNTCYSLNDDYPAIIVADACSNQDTDYFNLGQAMMVQGGVGFLGSTKVALGSPGWNGPEDGSSQSLDYYFTTSVTSGEYSAGQSHQLALTEMYINGLWNDNRYETFEWGAYLGNPNMFMMLPPLQISFLDEIPEIVDPGQSLTLSMEIIEKGDNIVAGSELLHYRFDDGPYQTASLTHIDGSIYEAIIPPAQCGETPSFYISVDTENSGVIYSPSDAPTSTHSYLVGSLTVQFQDNFETDLAWTVVDGTGLTAGSWERGIPAGGGDRGDPPTDYDGSGSCYLTGNTDGDSDVDGGITWLISPSLDLSNGMDAKVEYALWYTNNYGADPNNDLFKVYASNDNGDTWVLVDTIGPQSLSGWEEFSFMIADFLTLTDQMKLRFEASDLNDGSVVEAAIDAVSVSLFDCQDGGPIANFTYEPNDPVVNDLISFTDLSVPNEHALVNWTWDFDDGNHSYLQYPEHQYSAPGNYTVCLTVIDETDKTDTFCLTVSVYSRLMKISDLSTGWNCVSVPVNQTVLAADVIVKIGEDEYSWSEAWNLGILEPSVYWFDSTSQQYQYMMSENVELTPGLGFWFYSYQDCELWIDNLTYPDWNQVVFELLPGWNNLGVQDGDVTSLGELSVEYDGEEYNWSEAWSLGLVEPSVFYFDSVNQQYQYLIGDDALLNPGDGYWFFAYEFCQLKKS